MFSRYNFEYFTPSAKIKRGFYIYVRSSSLTSKRKVLKLGISSDIIASNIKHKYLSIYHNLIETNYLFISQRKYDEIHAKVIISHLNALCINNYGIRYSPFVLRHSKPVKSCINYWYMFNDMNFKKVTHAISKFFKSLQ